MSGHGWVTPNPDGSKARCGGPGMCAECSREMLTEGHGSVHEPTWDGLVPERTDAFTDTRVQANAVMVRGIIKRGDAGKIDRAELRELVRGYLARRGVELERDGRGQDTLEAFCFNYAPPDALIPECSLRPAASLAPPFSWMFGYIQRTYGKSGPEIAMQGKPVRTAPYVGQPVHYVSLGSADGLYPSVCRAATVTHVHDADEPGEVYVAVCVLNPEGLFFNQGVRMDPGTYKGAERRTSLAEGALPLITCTDLKFRPGTWHFIPEAP